MNIKCSDKQRHWQIYNINNHYYLKVSGPRNQYYNDGIKVNLSYTTSYHFYRDIRCGFKERIELHHDSTMRIYLYVNTIRYKYNKEDEWTLRDFYSATIN